MSGNLEYEKRIPPQDSQAVRDATDEGQIRRAKDQQKADREQELRDLAHVLSTEQGRRFIWRILDTAGVHRSTFHTHGSVLAFNEGRRDVGLAFMKDLSERFPDDYLLMLQEMQRRHQKTRA